MTGLLIGVFYAIRGLFQLITTALVVPFISHHFSGNWLGYFLVNIVMGVVSFVVYVCVARRYKYREREMSHVISVNMPRSITPIHSKKDITIMMTESLQKEFRVMH